LVRGPVRSQAQEAFNPWNAYRTRWEAIRTASIYTTETVHMLRPVEDPMEAPKTIYMEGKIDRPNRRSKANLLLNFGTMEYGIQMKASPETSHTLERSVMVVRDRWIPLQRDTPTTTTENPEALLLDMLLLPDPRGEWRQIEGPEDTTIRVDGLSLPATFLTYRDGPGTRLVTLSVDGRAVRGVRVLDSSGRLRSVAEVRSFTRADPVGFIPRVVLFRQFDTRGEPYRDLAGVVVVRFNDPQFDYLFE